MGSEKAEAARGRTFPVLGIYVFELSNIELNQPS